MFPGSPWNNQPIAPTAPLLALIAGSAKAPSSASTAPLCMSTDKPELTEGAMRGDPARHAIPAGAVAGLRQGADRRARQEPGPPRHRERSHADLGMAKVNRSPATRWEP
jgi:hypothetical protein